MLRRGLALSLVLALSSIVQAGAVVNLVPSGFVRIIVRLVLELMSKPVATLRGTPIDPFFIVIVCSPPNLGHCHQL